ncbi:MAG TPA: PQQ-dependent sugar dehydrogenase [Thermomicrobiales bacterium]|nr:PQQ-dependent sugar dehydrogenase [Thermomicrobiales bacterium]
MPEQSRHCGQIRDRRPITAATLSIWRLAVVLALALVSLPLGHGQLAAQGDASPLDISLTPVVAGFDQPLGVVQPDDGTDRLFVVEQSGQIKIVTDGEIAPRPFLDLTSVVGTNGSERGLLSLAFHPDYAENRFFYVDYTDTNGDSVIARYQVSDDPGLADPESEQVLMRVDQPFPNHNGGLLLFGPDGYLYVGFGDGGSAGDPHGNAQDLGTVLGTILRLDVDPDAVTDETPYLIPEDNPFVNEAGARPEIWAYGLRNPWRFSFDRETGDLWIADVGQNAWEEVNYQPAASDGGENYGWVIREGAHCYPEGDTCTTEGLVDPVAEYSHDLGYSVTGGYVYRGEAVPDLNGTHLFADFGSGLMWGLTRDGDDWVMTAPLETGLTISAFGEDLAGELYVTSFDGTVYRVTGSR